ncbi:MAG: 4Fe-4S dicluster domain-containing protein, partial [Deltaproteobacteria bacterium]|nr:4Fe-4S dicluster domain-containing protein [Deltaproteobacteria bacterium]
FNTIDRKVFKCDLCDGDPQCVRFCEVNAIEYVDADDVSILKKKAAAQRISVAGKEAAVLQAAV